MRDKNILEMVVENNTKVYKNKVFNVNGKIEQEILKDIKKAVTKKVK